MERGGARGVSYRSLVGYLLSTAKLDVLAFLHEHLSGPLEDLLALECNHDGFALLWLHLRDNIDEFIEVFSHLRVFAFRGDDGEGKEQNARQEKDARRAWEKRETAGHGHRGVAEQKRTRYRIEVSWQITKWFLIANGNLKGVLSVIIIV